MKRINVLAAIVLVLAMVYVYFAVRAERDLHPLAYKTLPIPALIQPVQASPVVASTTQIAMVDSAPSSNQSVRPSCNAFSAHWAMECMDFGAHPLTDMQKAVRFNECSLYAIKVSSRLAEGIDTMDANDAQKIAQIHQDLLKLCVLEGRDKFPSDAEIDASFRKLDQMTHQK